jgi:hypothetical protein
LVLAPEIGAIFAKTYQLLKNPADFFIGEWNINGI